MDVRLLSQPNNFAVVQLAQRNYPGVVVQGDTLHTIVQNIELMMSLLSARNFDELDIELGHLKEQLSTARNHYENVCRENGISLPYLK